jgi:hypothetical protein
VVTDEDYEGGNYPVIDRMTREYNRNYPSYELREQPDVKTLIAIMTFAYYSGACIDYIEADYDYQEDGLTEDEYQALLEKETTIMNEFLDILRDGYGLTEVGCIGVASNGEAFYREIN